jgi:hypothetical protein
MDRKSAGPETNCANSGDDAWVLDGLVDEGDLACGVLPIQMALQLSGKGRHGGSSKATSDGGAKHAFPSIPSRRRWRNWFRNSL